MSLVPSSFSFHHRSPLVLLLTPWETIPGLEDEKEQHRLRSPAECLLEVLPKADVKGTIDFSFVCKECPPGTFSDSKMDCCIPWTDCSLNGFQTIRQGNRTHNVQCGNSVIVERDSTFTSVLAILTAAGIFLIIFMMVFLLLCMWTQKAAKVPVMEDPEAVDAAKFLQRPQQREDSVSCQYPEEEHGHKLAEEKDSTLFLAH